MKASEIAEQILERRERTRKLIGVVNPGVQQAINAKVGQREPLLSTQELAAHLGFSVSTVLRMVREGLPKYTTRGFSRGLKYRFKVSEVEAWMRSKSSEE